MNKEEIQKGLVRARVAETIIKKNIIELLEQLVEAEKPKLRHGDFGNNKDNRSFVATRGYLPHKYLEPYYENGESDGSKYAKNNPGDYTILGNTFALLKEWSKDLTFFQFDVHRCEINTVEFAHAPIHIAGNWHTLAEAEEIWHKLGRVIATLKRKQPGIIT